MVREPKDDRRSTFRPVLGTTRGCFFDLFVACRIFCCTLIISSSVAHLLDSNNIMHSFCVLPVFLAAFLQVSAFEAFQINEWQEGQGRDAVIDRHNAPFAEYWNSLASLSVDDNSNHLKVDGYSFKCRMAIYHYLMNSIDSGDLWGESSLREYHWLWAYAAQLDWQNRPRRLQSSDEEIENDMISHDFGFSVAVLLGWKETRPDITIELDSISQRLIENDKAMQKCIQGWESFFQNGYREFVDTLNHTSTSMLEARYELQHHVWDAHTSVIDYCQNEGTVYSALMKKLPPTERKFGEGWARMVHVLAAACFPTDLVTKLCRH